MTTATTTVPTTYSQWAEAVARELDVQPQLDAILDRARQTVRGLRWLEVDADTQSEMGLAVVVRAGVDPACEDDPSHRAWWEWRIDEYGPEVAAAFNIVVYPDRGDNAR